MVPVDPFLWPPMACEAGVDASLASLRIGAREGPMSEDATTAAAISQRCQSSGHTETRLMSANCSGKHR